MPAVHEHRLRVRYAETDQMGVVYHANYLVYMEEARTRFLETLGHRYGDLERSGLGLAVRRAEVRYRAPALFEDELRVRTRIERLGGASITFSYEIERLGDGTAVASGRTELACLALREPGRPVTMLPEALREALGRAEAAPG